MLSIDVSDVYSRLVDRVVDLIDGNRGGVAERSGLLAEMTAALRWDGRDWDGAKHYYFTDQDDLETFRGTVHFTLCHWMAPDTYADRFWYIQKSPKTCGHLDHNCPAPANPELGHSRAATAARTACWLARQDIGEARRATVVAGVAELNSRWPSWATRLACLELKRDETSGWREALRAIASISDFFEYADQVPSHPQMLEAFVDARIAEVDLAGESAGQRVLAHTLARLAIAIRRFNDGAVGLEWLRQTSQRAAQSGGYVPRHVWAFLAREASSRYEALPLTADTALESHMADAARQGDGEAAMFVADALISQDPMNEVAMLEYALDSSYWPGAASRLAARVEQGEGIDEDQGAARGLQRALFDLDMRGANRGNRADQLAVGNAIAEGRPIRIGSFKGADFPTLNASWASARIWWLRAAGARNPFAPTLEKMGFEWLDPKIPEESTEAGSEGSFPPAVRIDPIAIAALARVAEFWRLGMGSERCSDTAERILEKLDEKGGRPGILASARARLEMRRHGIRLDPAYAVRRNVNEFGGESLAKAVSAVRERSGQIRFAFPERFRTLVSRFPRSRTAADEPVADAPLGEQLAERVDLASSDEAGAAVRLAICTEQWQVAGTYEALPTYDSDYEADYERWARRSYSSAAAASAIHRLLLGFSQPPGGPMLNRSPLDLLNAARHAGFKFPYAVGRHMDLLDEAGALRLAALERHFRSERSLQGRTAVLRELETLDGETRGLAMLWLELRMIWASLLRLPDAGWWSSLAKYLQLSLAAFQERAVALEQTALTAASSSAARAALISRATVDTGPLYNQLSALDIPLPGQLASRHRLDRGWRQIDCLDIGRRSIRVNGESDNLLPPLVRPRDLDVLVALVMFEDDLPNLATFSLEAFEPLAAGGTVRWRLSHKIWKPDWLGATDFGKSLYDVDRLLSASREENFSLRDPSWSAAFESGWEVPYPYQMADLVGGLSTKPLGRLTFTLAGIRGGASEPRVDGGRLIMPIAPAALRITGGETAMVDGRETRSIGSDDPAYHLWREAAVLTDQFEALDHFYPVFGRVGLLLGILAHLAGQREHLARYRDTPLGRRLKSMRESHKSARSASRFDATDIVFQ